MFVKKSFPEFDKRYLVAIIPKTEHTKIERPWLERYISSCLSDDDVFQVEFLSVLIFSGHQDPGSGLSAEVRSLLESWGTKHYVILAEHEDLLPGPHLVIGGRLYQVLRLYDDDQAAFLISVRESPQPQYVSFVFKSCKIGSRSPDFLLAAMSC